MTGGWSPIAQGTGARAVRELRPDDPVHDTKTWQAARKIPGHLAAFRRYPNVDEWQPGDLLLTCELEPDIVSKCITSLQSFGYGEHARWTHAAIYVGDGWRVCEATVDEGLPPRGDVRLTAIWDFCNERTVLRLRRPQVSRDIGWLMVIEAMTQLRQSYEVGKILQYAANVVRDKSEWHAANPKQVSAPLVCSTLYANAYRRVTRKVIEENDGMCMPALLSLTPEFEDIPLYWRRLLC